MIKNIFSYATFQIANFLLPLLAFPYFLRVLSDSQIGILALSTTLNAYFLVFSDFGFNISATKDVANNRDDSNYLNEIFSSVLYIKLIILIFIFTLFAFVLFFLDSSNRWFFLLNFLSVVGTTLYPMWFLQGLGKIHFFTIFNIIIRSFFVLSSVVMVKTNNEFYLIPVLNGVGFLLSSLVGIVYITRRLSVKIVKLSIENIKLRILNSIEIFYSRILVSLYTTSNILVLGSLSNPIIIAKYSIIDKFLFIAGAAFEPINQVIYPRLVQLKNINLESFNRIINNYFALTLVFSIIAFFSITYLGELMIYILTGTYDNELYGYLIKSFLIIMLIPLGPFLSNLLIIKNLNKEFLKIIKITVLVDLLLVPISIWYFSLDGLFISYFIVLLTHVILLFISFRKNYESFQFQLYR